MSAHAKRALRAKLSTRVTAVLDAGIALLQRLRTKVGGAPVVEEDEDRPGSRPDRSRDRYGAATPPVETAAEAPKPRRRLRTSMIYLSVLLAGGMAGGALSYSQFQKQLGQQFRETQRLEEALVKKTRPSAEIRKAFEDEQARRNAAEKKLASTLAEYSESTSDSYNLLESLLGQQLAESRHMEAALAESTRSGAEARKALENEQARRAEAEAKLASTLAETSKVAAENQRQLDAAERQLARLHAGEESRRIEREAPTSRRAERRRVRPVRTGNCTLEAKGVDALKDCIADFNE